MAVEGIRDALAWLPPPEPVAASAVVTAGTPVPATPPAFAANASAHATRVGEIVRPLVPPCPALLLPLQARSWRLSMLLCWSGQAMLWACAASCSGQAAFWACAASALSKDPAVEWSAAGIIVLQSTRTRVGENAFFVFSFRFLFQLSMFAMSFQNWYSVGCAVLCELGRDKTYKTCGPEITKRVPKITRTKRRIREYQTPQLHWSKGWSGYFLKALQTQFFALHNTV